MKKFYLECLDTIGNIISNHNTKNLRVESVSKDESRILFEITLEDNIVKTCILGINIKPSRSSYSKSIKSFIEEDFKGEFVRLNNDGTLESEFDDEDSDPLYCDVCDVHWDAEDEERCHDLCETADSVADGLGLYIDEDGHWVPKEHNYFDDEYSEMLEPYGEYRILEDGSIEFVDSYQTFELVYKDDIKAKEYLKEEFKLK